MTIHFDILPVRTQPNPPISYFLLPVSQIVEVKVTYHLRTHRRLNLHVELLMKKAPSWPKEIASLQFLVKKSPKSGRNRVPMFEL